MSHTNSWRPADVKHCDQGHVAARWQSVDLNPGGRDPEAIANAVCLGPARPHKHPLWVTSQLHDLGQKGYFCSLCLSFPIYKMGAIALPTLGGTGG